MLIVEIDVLDILNNNYIIEENCTILIKIKKDNPYWNKLSFSYPKSNIQKITDNFNRELPFFIRLKNDNYYIYLNLLYLYNDEPVNKLYIIVDKINLLYEFQKPQELYYKKISDIQLYSDIENIDGNKDYVYYFDNPFNTTITEYVINEDQIKELDITPYVQDFSNIKKSTSILFKDIIDIDVNDLYRVEMKYLIPQDYSYPTILGGIRYNTNGDIIGGFNNGTGFSYDGWDYFLDRNELDYDKIYGVFRYGVLDTNYGWGKGLNITNQYKFGIFQNFNDPYEKQHLIIEDQKFYNIIPEVYTGLHLYKNDESNQIQKITYNINDSLLQKHLNIKLKFTKIDLTNTDFTMFLYSYSHSNNIQISIEKQNKNPLAVLNQEYHITLLDSASTQDYHSYIVLDKNDFTFIFKTTNDKILVYLNDKLIFELDSSFFYINKLQIQVGKENIFTSNSHIILDYISVVKSYNKKFDSNYNEIDYPSIDVSEHSSIIFNTINNMVVSHIPLKIKQEQNIYPYLYNFEEVGEEYLLDLQYKNYFRKYTQRVSVLDELFQIDNDIKDIENYLWRQNTPFYIREEAFENENFVYTIFVHSLQNVIQKLKYISDEFGNVFDPYNSELYIKRTFYYYINDIGILQDYLSGIEFNSQIYMLLSINFYKHIMYYTEYSGLYSCIDKILNDQFSNISSIVQLYVFIFRKLKDVEIYEFSSNKKIINFKNFLKNDGFYNVFHKQKINQFIQYKEYINNYSKKLYIMSKFVKGVISENILDNIINVSIDSLLQSSIYRSLIVVYDDFLVRSYNMEESIFTFFEFIKNHYLPQNMDIIFIKQSEFSISLNDIENKQHNIKDFGIFEFNTLTEFYTKINNLFSKDTITNGIIQ